MTEPADDLPPVLAEIAEASSVETALAIAERYGGMRVTIPVSAGRNWLTDLVGTETAIAIIQALGPVRRIDVPLGPTGSFARQQIRMGRRFAELLESGASESQMARALGITGRAVRRRRAKLRQRLTDNRQPDLFD